MPFVLRTTTTPTIPQTTEIEQIVVVDKTGPVINLGLQGGVACLNGEFLKGPFKPAEVTSQGDILSTFVGDTTKALNLLSQSGVSSPVQDGSGQFFDGNGFAELKGKTFRRLILNRVDQDMTTTDGGAAKAFVAFTVTIDTTDKDPFDATRTGRDLVIPAGTRFADAPLGTETAIVALSQDVYIPKGTKIRTTNNIFISSVAVDTGAADDEVFNVSQNVDTGVLTLNVLSTGFPSLAVAGSLGVTALFVKGTTLAIAALDTAIDTTLPNSLSTIAATGISTVNGAAAASAIFAAGTAAASLYVKNGSLYSAAITKTLPMAFPQEDINYIWSARNTLTIRAALWTNAKDSASSGRGRVAVVSAPVAAGSTSSDATTAKNFANQMNFGTGAEFPGEDADRASTNFPYVKVFSSELNKNILVSPAGFKVVLFSNLPEEVESGVQNTLLGAIQGVEDAFVTSPLTRGDFVNFKARGVSAIRRDPAVGWWFQSSVTAVNPVTYPTRAKDNRRRYADFVQDTLVAISGPYNKQPGTTERVDTLVGEFDAFLASQVSAENPSQQRIEGYFLDAKSGNTPQLTAIGIRVIIVKVRMLGDLDDIVLETQIGPTVEINQAA